MTRVISTVLNERYRARFESEFRPNLDCNDPYAYTQRVLLSPDHKLYIRRHSTADGLIYVFNPTGVVRWMTVPGKPFTMCLMSGDERLFNVELQNLLVDIKRMTSDNKLMLTITNPHKVTYLQKGSPLGINFSPIPNYYRQLAPWNTTEKIANNLEILIVVILSLLSLYEVNMITYPRRSHLVNNKSIIFPIFIQCIASLLFFTVFSVYTLKPKLQVIHGVFKNCAAAVFTGINLLVLKDIILQPEMDYMLLTLQQITLVAALKISVTNWEE